MQRKYKQILTDIQGVSLRTVRYRISGTNCRTTSGKKSYTGKSTREIDINNFQVAICVARGRNCYGHMRKHIFLETMPT